MASIAVALSGGGYRASLFGLGVLMYLADAGKNREVTSVSSVSGGSITNGFVAQSKGYHQRDGAEFREEVRPLARAVARETLWSTPRVWTYLISLIVTLLAIVYLCFWVTPWAWWARLFLFVVLLLPWGWLLQQRGIVAGRAFGTKLFSPRGAPTRLEDIEPDIDHVLCATHMNAGEHFYFSGGFVYSYRFGWGVPGGLPLHAAVQASAAFPGGFPPRLMRTGRFKLDGGQGPPDSVPWLVTLTDGGVYDNMADEWPSGIGRRAAVKPDNLDLKVPDEVVVVNASAGLAWSAVRKLRVPLFGEFLALMRDVSIMYDNSTSLRMRGLVDRFQAGTGLKGVLVNIEQSPFKIPQAYDHGNSPEAQRARAAMAKLGDANEWAEVTRENAAVATTLSKLGVRVTARLMRHGYATAMANLHVILDYPLLDLPDAARFEALAR